MIGQLSNVLEMFIYYMRIEDDDYLALVNFSGLTK